MHWAVGLRVVGAIPLPERGFKTFPDTLLAPSVCSLSKDVFMALPHSQLCTPCLFARYVFLKSLTNWHHMSRSKTAATRAAMVFANAYLLKASVLQAKHRLFVLSSAAGQRTQKHWCRCKDSPLQTNDWIWSIFHLMRVYVSDPETGMQK